MPRVVKLNPDFMCAVVNMLKMWKHIVESLQLILWHFARDQFSLNAILYFGNKMCIIFY